ncbi:Transcriptional regulatory protein MctR [Nymphon striatum]|nr:Transcriptional regulatory protein MctR [Nymphon striatum]
MQSTLFRLTQSSYSKFLPKIVVFHCTSAELNGNEMPSLIDDEFKVIISSIEEDANVLHDLRKCGADGFISKDATSGEYSAAVQAVTAGGLYFSQNMANTIFQVALATNDKRNAYGLTGREMEILSLLSSGYCNKEVANKYDLSVRTVEAHRLNIRRKTQSNTLSDLVRVSRSLGLANMTGNSRGKTTCESDLVRKGFRSIEKNIIPDETGTHLASTFKILRLGMAHARKEPVCFQQPGKLDTSAKVEAIVRDYQSTAKSN